jgi:hypothetical protein
MPLTVDKKKCTMGKLYSKHESDLIGKYQEKGYIGNFRFQNGKIIDPETQKAFDPEEIFIVAEHRYEGISNPSDMSILYVLETQSGAKGTMLLGYGPTADLDAANFYKNIPKANCSNRENILRKS